MKILSICGSPRKGNSEAIIRRLGESFKKNGMENEVILLREKKIGRCLGCVEYCNRQLKCRIRDDMDEIMEKMREADGFVFVTPNYWQMPPGIFKDFVDRCSLFYTSGTCKQFKNKKAVVICVGADTLENIAVCTNNVVDCFCKTMGMKVVGRKSFRGRSELKGDEDIFKSGLNLKIKEDLEKLVGLLTGKD